jgi:hypothetical protein
MQIMAHTTISISASPQRRSLATVAAAAFVLLATVAAALPDRPGSHHLKPAQQAILRVDDQAVKEWDVYQVEKNNDRLLVQLGGRFLLVDAQQQQVFELVPGTIERKGSDLLWDPMDRPEKPLATSNWVARDVGPALRIRVRLDAEGRALDLQLPHPSSRR